jgi:hypothetical protein
MFKSQRVILDSYFRYSGTNDKPKFSIPENGIKAGTVYVNSISIPHTFYNAVNWRFNWVDSNSTTHQLVIPDGDYTLDEIIRLIEDFMNSSTTDGSTYSVVLDTNTHRITISNGGGGNFGLNNNTGFVLTRLGFNFLPETDTSQGGDIVRGMANLAGSNSYTAIDTYYISKRNLYIGSSLLANTKNYESLTIASFRSGSSLTGAFSRRKDIFTSIPVNSNYGDIIVWKAGNDVVRHCLSNNITEIEFAIYDEFFNRISLNGRSWVIELVFEG